MGYGIYMADTKVVPMRWPTDLLAEVDAVVERGGRTAFVLDAVRDRLATRYGAAAGRVGSRSAPSSEATEPEPAEFVPRSLTGGVKVPNTNTVNITSGRLTPTWPVNAVVAQKQTQGPTCPRCGGLATMQGGKAVCTQKWCK